MTDLARPARRVQRRTHLARLASLLSAGGALTLGLFLAAPAAARYQGPPAALTDSEFWELFTTMSESGGSFVSENFVSNEVSFQDVIPTLQRTLTSGGVYLGVGPEQNFTYIANLKPAMAVIVDIRRQNAMQHLMYKAVFEASPTRAEFVARLFSRPDLARMAPTVSVAALFDSAFAAAPSDSAYRANLNGIVTSLTERHGFALTQDDIASITHVYRVFYEAGPGVNYGYRPGSPERLRTSYPNFGQLQAATNADSAQMAFLATEENYRTVRELQRRNLVVPLVGDFAGPKAIRSAGDYLRKLGLTVTAFYLSNVEQYLFRQSGASDRFYGNVAALPLDSTSTFIRSVPRTGGAGAAMSFSSGTIVVRVPPGSPPPGVTATGPIIGWSVIDSGGVRITRMIQDSAGRLVFRNFSDSAAASRTADSLRVATLARQDSTMARALRDLIAGRDSSRPPIGRSMPAMSMVMGGLLSSGLVSIHETLDAFFAGRLVRYEDVIAMTRTTGWK